MRAYLTIWRDAAGHATAYQILLADGILSAMALGHDHPRDVHASYHRLIDTPSTHHAIEIAKHLPRLPVLCEAGMEGKMSFCMQEDLTKLGTGVPITLKRWAFIERAHWEDAEAVMVKRWPRQVLSCRDVSAGYTYSIENATHHLQKWVAPLEAYDLGFPEVAPARAEAE